jgi:predicted nucleic acid-binding protein
MNDLTNLTNTQLGEFISLSLIHGTNTQFSYELLHEVAERLVQTDEIIKAGINYALKNQDVGTIKPLLFTLDEVAQALDEVLAENADEDNDETKEAVEIITDLMAHEAMDKAIKESAKAFEEEAVEEVPVKKEPKKKEKPTVKESLTVETLQPVEIVEETPSITAEALKTKALEMRQKNTISRDAITAKLAEYGATTILKLDPTVYNEFNAFLESHNV